MAEGPIPPVAPAAAVASVLSIGWEDAVDRPYDALDSLPREVWLPALVTAVGTPAARLRHGEGWLAALARGELPDAALDFGDAVALAPLRRAIGELALPSMAAGAPAAARQVLRAALWHLDRLIDRPASQTRADAIATMVEAFRAEWSLQRGDWEQVLALLQGLGDLAALRRDALRGRLARREWGDAQALAELLGRVPALTALIAALGRALPRDTPEPPAPSLQPQGEDRAPGHWAPTRVPDAPGHLLGVRTGRNLARMLPSEAAHLRHPLLHKLWRARLAEGQLRVWDEEALLGAPLDGGALPLRARPDAEPPPAGRGPMLVCIDTSGSMRGAPERLAKAVVLEAARTAHRERRVCRLFAFGGEGELLVHDLTFTAAGLDALLDFIGQTFDGGTDLAAPIAQALAAVNAAAWRQADLLVVSDGEFGCTEATLRELDAARERHGLRVQGVLVGDRETIGLLEVCDRVHWVCDWRRFRAEPAAAHADGHSPVHSKSLTALYFPNALSARARRSLRT